MDNVTHTLIGVTLGHALTPRRLRSERAYLRAAVWTSVISSNFADLDTLFARIAGAGRIGYLLHHRGYTHTLVFAPVIALISAIAGILIAGRRKRGVRSRWLALLGVGLAGALLHIGADLWNDYGVHPLAPFFPRWYYGDSVFIIEPALWLCMIPFVFQIARSKLARGVLGALALAILFADAVALRSSGMPASAAGILSASLLCWTAFAAIAQKRLRSWLVPVTGIVCVLLSFGICSRIARARFSAELARLAPRESVIQMASSPFPSNPVCWRFLTASISGPSYVARLATASLLPAWIPPRNCVFKLSRGADAGHTIALAPVSLAPSPMIAWIGEFRGDISALRSGFANDCRFRDLLKFARIPFWESRSSELVAGDLRYDRGKGPGFATFRWEGAPENARCEPFSPGWEPPLHALLR